MKYDTQWVAPARQLLNNLTDISTKISFGEGMKMRCKEAVNAFLQDTIKEHQLSAIIMNRLTTARRVLNKCETRKQQFLDDYKKNMKDLNKINYIEGPTRGLIEALQSIDIRSKIENKALMIKTNHSNSWIDYFKHPIEQMKKIFEYEIKAAVINKLIERNTFDEQHDDYRKRKPQRKDMVGIHKYCDHSATMKNLQKKRNGLCEQGP